MSSQSNAKATRFKEQIYFLTGIERMLLELMKVDLGLVMQRMGALALA